MHELELDKDGRKASPSVAMYDLCKDRRVASRRIVDNEANSFIERRKHERRVDDRPLNEFPYLPPSNY